MAASQAEVWDALNRSKYVTFFGDDEAAIKAWQRTARDCAQPSEQWEPIVVSYHGRYSRITRMDFPDSSSVIAIETWHPSKNEEGRIYGYELRWEVLPVPD